MHPITALQTEYSLWSRVVVQGGDVIPIPGTKKVSYLEETIAAADIVLSHAELAAIDAALPAGLASGERYSPEAMRALNG